MDCINFVFKQNITYLKSQKEFKDYSEQEITLAYATIFDHRIKSDNTELQDKIKLFLRKDFNNYLELQRFKEDKQELKELYAEAKPYIQGMIKASNTSINKNKKRFIQELKRLHPFFKEKSDKLIWLFWNFFLFEKFCYASDKQILDTLKHNLKIDKSKMFYYREMRILTLLNIYLYYDLDFKALFKLIMDKHY
jgi:hypothetical protein